MGSFFKVLAVALLMAIPSYAGASDIRTSGGSGGGQGPAGPSTLVVAGSSQIPLSGANIVYVGATSSSDAADVGIPATALTTFNTVAVTLSNAPGTGTTWTITVMRDGTPITATSTTITHPNQYALLTSVSQSFDAGQKFSLKVEPTLGSPAPTIINFTAQAVLN
jgi:archaellin